MADAVQRVRFEKEFRVCPGCGYRDGFHSMLERGADKVKWLFICPACHKIFDIGYRVAGDAFKPGE